MIDSMPVKRSVLLVAQREIMARLRSKPFIISISVLIALVWAAVAIPAVVFATQQDTPEVADTDTVAVIGSAPEVFSGSGFETVPYADRATAEAAVKAGDVDAAVAFDSATQRWTVIALESAPDQLVQALTVHPQVKLLEPAEAPSILGMVSGVIFGALLMFVVVTFGSYIAQSVVEEKASRIVEILLATVSPRALMLGKILGNLVLVLGILTLMFLPVIVAAPLLPAALPVADLLPALLWFLPLVITGFVLYGTLYAAAGSLVSRQEELAAVITPLMLVAMVPYMLGFLITDAGILRVLSYVPFFAPALMPARIASGNAVWWEPVVALVIIVATIALMIILAARVYERSVLQTGARVKLTHVLKLS